ncbi:rod shape-determining protein MreD [Desulfarculales bacterium]
MTKRDESPWTRLLATALLGFLLTVLSTTLFAWWPVGAMKLQPVVVMVVSAGFRLSLVPACALAMFLGYLNDLISGGVLGLQVLAYIVVACVCAVAQRKLEISSWPFQMMAVGILTLVTQLAMIGGVVLVHRGQLVSLGLHLILTVQALLSQALLSALTAPVFFALLEALVGIFTHLWSSRAKSEA